MTIRFFILQAQYRSTLDFSNEALQAAEKGLIRLLKGVENLNNLKANKQNNFDAQKFRQDCYNAMNDDLNSPILISYLFDGLKTINSIVAGNENIDENNLNILKEVYDTFLFEILGLKLENENSGNNKILENVVNIVLNLRVKAKENKDWASSDFIRDELAKIGIIVKDKKDGFEWEIQ